MLNKVVTVEDLVSVSTGTMKEFETLTENVDDYSAFANDDDFEWADDEFLFAIATLVGDPVSDLNATGSKEILDNDSASVMKTPDEEVEENENEDLVASEKLMKAEYRKASISRWREKRKRRSFAKKVVCKARGDVANQRVRVGGRFVKTMKVEWVSVTTL